ncbi:MAG TPA: septation protein A [Gammaproteobacteria bacterium]
MKLLYDFFPIILFFIAYKTHDLFVATGVAIIASILQVGFYWWKHRRFERMHLVSTALIIVLGGLTLLLRNNVFIMWKPTVVNWLFALAFAGSHFIGRKPMIAHMLDQQIQLPPDAWRKLNLGWIAFFIIAGAANLFVAFNFSENVWVNFKLFGLLGMTLIFIVLQAIFLSSHLSEADDNSERKN